MAATTKPKILIVDSMNGARRIVARHLTNHGFQTLEACDVASGREMAVVNLPDVIVTDVRLAGLDAVPMIRALRSVPALDATPIVVTSAVGDDKTMVAAIQAGASDYVVKPVALDVLRARLGAQLRAKKLHDEVRARRRESEILFETLHAATESGTVDEILFRITQRLGRMMTASRCSIIAVNDRRRIGTIAASMEDPRARGIQLDLSRYPEVLEAVVVGVPERRWGEVPIAVARPRADCAPDAETVREWVNRRVAARYQRLHAVLIVDELPRNVAGKVLRRELRDRYRDLLDGPAAG